MPVDTVTVGTAPWIPDEDVIGYPCMNEGDCVGADDFIEMSLGDGEGEVSIETREVPGEGERKVVVLNE